MSKFRIKPSGGTAFARASKGASFGDVDALVGYVTKSDVPEGGWTNENFVGDARRRLRSSMVQVQRAVILRTSQSLTKNLTKFLNGNVENVIANLAKVYRSIYGVDVGKAAQEVVVTTPVYESIWMQAIEQEMSRADMEVLLVLETPIRGAVDKIHEEVSVLLGSNPTRPQLSALGTRSRALARDVTRLNETTRNRLVGEMRHAINNNLTVFEAIERMRERIPTIASNRVPTIVRTELGMAADEAVKHSMKWSGVVTHFDVVGCSGIEPNIPTLLGVPTCNIERVPIIYESQISFHPNHTGAIVASAFRQSDGSEPKVRPMGNGELDPLDD